MSKSQKFIGRNRAPRVQIQYDVETYGAEKKAEIPFVVGVLADLAGDSKSAEVSKPIDQRSFGKINPQNFDQRMASIEPKISFEVDNTLTPQKGRLPISLTFKSMDDFSPIRVAEKVDGLKDYVALRRHLVSLLNAIDGKREAQTMLSDLLDGKDSSAETLRRLIQQSTTAPNAQTK